VLKITINETAVERRWILQGQLVGPWVQELRSLWKKKRKAQEGQMCVLDLNEVTFIDKSGERLLRAICKKGAQLVASGVYTKYLVEKARTKQRCSVPTLPLVFLAALLIVSRVSANCLQVGPNSGRTAGLERAIWRCAPADGCHLLEMGDAKAKYARNALLTKPIGLAQRFVLTLRGDRAHVESSQ
jgi:hypothetical protein